MKVWKDKSGNKITAKEFSKRFKEGIQNITPEQKLSNDIRATFITFIGYLVGFISIIVFFKEFPNGWLAYALILIFLGSAYSSATKFLMLLQQKKFFKNMNSESMDFSNILNKMEENQ